MTREDLGAHAGALIIVVLASVLIYNVFTNNEPSSWDNYQHAVWDGCTRDYAVNQSDALTKDIVWIYKCPEGPKTQHELYSRVSPNRAHWLSFRDKQ